MTFSGANYNSIPYSADFNFGAGDWAVMAWVRCTQVSDCIIGAFNSGSPYAGFSLEITGTGALYMFVSNGASFEQPIFGTGNLADGVLRHLCVTQISNTYQAWVNGVTSGSSIAATKDPAGSSQTIYTARDSNASPSRTFHGDLYDVRMYKDTTLEAGHIKSIYENRGNDNITSGLVFRQILLEGHTGDSVTSAYSGVSPSTHIATPVSSPTHLAKQLRI